MRSDLPPPPAPAPPPAPPPSLQTDLFGELAVQVVNQRVKVLQAEPTVKRSVKVQEVIHVQSSAPSCWPCPLLLLLVFIITP